VETGLEETRLETRKTNYKVVIVIPRRVDRQRMDDSSGFERCLGGQSGQTWRCQGWRDLGEVTLKDDPKCPGLGNWVVPFPEMQNRWNWAGFGGRGQIHFQTC